MKGVVAAISDLLGLPVKFNASTKNDQFQLAAEGVVNDKPFVQFGLLSNKVTAAFDCKQPVYFADFDWDAILSFTVSNSITYKEISKYPAVERDLALVVSKQTEYKDITAQVEKLKLQTLKEVKLFDVFESEKLGKDKKSLAVNFTFLDTEKTLTDKEIDGWMNKIMTTLEKETGAEIRK